MPPSRAVSHVVGVALLVAIVTLLAGSMAVMLGSFGDAGGEPVPNAVIETTFDDRLAANGQYLNLTHEGGEVVDTDDLRLDVDGAESVSPAGDAVLGSNPIASQVGPEWSASETIVIDRRLFTDGGGTPLTASGANLDLADATVRIIYERGETETVILYECEVAMPDCSNREH